MFLPTENNIVDIHNAISMLKNFGISDITESAQEGITNVWIDDESASNLFPDANEWILDHVGDTIFDNMECRHYIVMRDKLKFKFCKLAKVEE